jgi:Fe-S-cluster containining protein
MKKVTTCHTDCAVAVPVSDQPISAPTPRTEFGFARTECACESCAAHCRVVPGYLVPDDVERISRHLGYHNPLSFASAHLLASPGATVLQEGRLRQIPTLVPRRQENGACLFLDENNRCRIHAVAPYGCAMFDSHQPADEANQRSTHGLMAIARAWANPKAYLYTLLWRILDATGRRALPPALARLQAARHEQAAAGRE